MRAQSKSAKFKSSRRSQNVAKIHLCRRVGIRSAGDRRGQYAENIRALRAALNTLGDGFVEAIDDSTLKAIAQHQLEAGGRIHGEAVEVPVLEAPGQTRIGRFGWKDQHSSLLSFIGDAYLNEMGVTNRLRPKDVTPVGKITSDPEDNPDSRRPTLSRTGI